MEKDTKRFLLVVLFIALFSYPVGYFWNEYFGQTECNPNLHDCSDAASLKGCEQLNKESYERCVTTNEGRMNYENGQLFFIGSSLIICIMIFFVIIYMLFEMYKK